MAETISSQVGQCLALFRSLVASPSPEGLKLSFPNADVVHQMVDEQSRFKVWSGSLGAHRTSTSSLDYRLRDASHIKEQVGKLLKDLAQLLQDALAIAKGELTPWDQQSEDEDVEDDEIPDLEDGFPATELGQIAESMADVVNCLFGIAIAIQNPAPHDRYIRTQAVDVSHFQPYDIQHVRSKFSGVKPWLADRLGTAISRRRHYLKYRQSHHEKLAHGLDRESDPGKALETQTVASSIPTHMKAGHATQNPLLMPDDDASDASVSLTSYASSTSGAGYLTVPPLPEEAPNGPFQCCFCYMMVVARDRAAWK